MPSTLPGETGALSDLLADASQVIVAKLFNNAIDEDKVPLGIVDFVEATFPGYAPITVGEYGMAETPDPKEAEAVSGPIEWESGVVVTPELIQGIYIVAPKTGFPDALVTFCKFPTPVAVTKEGVKITYQVRVTSVDIGTD